jgi:hypothetical protein
MIKSNLVNKVFLITAAFFLFSTFIPVLAEQGADSSDAIAVRVLPNPNHYSIYQWYSAQGFSGSPQSLTVDGYEAIRDGRSVYVNAANVDLGAGEGPSKKNIYTNIYLISYNQESSGKTVDILGQIISHWKFNSNIPAESTQPTCAISSLNCSSDSDCGANAYCQTSGKEANSCQLSQAKNCNIDQDCPSGYFCNSLKSKIIRDIKRLGYSQAIKNSLDSYRDNYDNYPSLSAGTYLAGRALSVWPSWSSSFLSPIGVAQDIVDPINRLGACPGYDPYTCWDNVNKSFAGFSNGTFVLPAGSYATSYFSADGKSYSLCSVMETDDTAYAFNPPNDYSMSCPVGVFSGGNVVNNAPKLVGSNLKGQTGREFVGYIKVDDEDGDQLSWNIQWSGASWGSTLPVLQDTSDPYQKKVYAPVAGNAGSYLLLLTVDDGRGGKLETKIPLSVFTTLPTIEAEDYSYTLDVNNNFSYSFYFSSDNLNLPANSYTFTKKSGPSGLDPFSGLSKTLTSVSTNKYKVEYKGSLANPLAYQASQSFVYQVKVTDKSGNFTSQDVNMTVNVVTPQLTLSCPASVRLNNPYSCQLGEATANFTVSGLPAGLLYGNGLISGSPTTAGNSTISVRLTNTYGSYVDTSFALKVNTYCGDGIKQAPNSEAKGGASNNGQESCDGNDGITSDPAQSSVSRQYACSTPAGAITPYPITTTDYCVFPSVNNGGGYCGDGFCTSQENCSSCESDCGKCSITISGKILNYPNYLQGQTDSSPVGFASCQVINNQGEIIANTTANNYGEYSVLIEGRHVSSSEYKLACSAADYSETKESFIPNKSKVVNVRLFGDHLAADGGFWGAADYKILLVDNSGNSNRFIESWILQEPQTGYYWDYFHDTLPALITTQIGTGSMYMMVTKETSRGNLPKIFLGDNPNNANQIIAAIDNASGGNVFQSFRLWKPYSIFGRSYSYQVVVEDKNAKDIDIFLYGKDGQLIKSFSGCELNDTTWTPFKINADNSLVISNQCNEENSQTQNQDAGKSEKNDEKNTVIIE